MLATCSASSSDNTTKNVSKGKIISIPLKIKERKPVFSETNVTDSTADTPISATSALSSTFSKNVSWLTGTGDYVGHVYVGTPGQQMELIFDTGSGALVVPTVGCEGCMPRKNANDWMQTYDPDTSATA